jgi:hypothetical protein
VPAGFAGRAVPAAKARLDRFATFSFATALTVAACGGIADDGANGELQGTPAVKDAGADREWFDAGNVMPSYGGGRFPEDAGPVYDASATDGGTKLDASSPDTGTVDDDGGVIAMYGIPWPDGGWDVNVQPPYGLPPLDGGPDDD